MTGSKLHFQILLYRQVVLLLIYLFSVSRIQAGTFTSIASGDWDAGTSVWSVVGDADNIPDADDDVTITGGNYTITVNGAFQCNNLTIGSSNHRGTLTISGTNSLIVNGNLIVDSGNRNKDYTINVDAGTLTVSGTFTAGTGNGNKQFNVTSGTLAFTRAAGITWNRDADIDLTTGQVTFTGALTLSGSGARLRVTDIGNFTFGGLVTQTDGEIRNNGTAGTINFNGGYSLSTGGTFTTMNGETINFEGPLTVTGTSLTFSNGSMANFRTTASILITPGAAITFSDFKTNVEVRLAGDISVDGDLTTNTGGSIVNNDATPRTIFMTGGNGILIDGTANPATFPVLEIVNTTKATLNCNAVITTLNISPNGGDANLTQGSGIMVTVTDVNLNQSTSNGDHGSWYINDGSATVSGTLSCIGTNTNNRKMQAVVTTGSLTVTTLSFSNNTTDANQVLNVTSTGSITVTNPFSQSDGSFIASGGGTINFTGQLTVTGGTIDIDGTSTISFNNTGTYALLYGTGSTPTLTTVSGSKLKFYGDLRATTAFTVHQNSESWFEANSTITPTATITFGGIQIDAATVTLAGNINVRSNWVNNGGVLIGGAHTVYFYTGTGKTIGGTVGTDFPHIRVGTTSIDATYSLTNGHTYSCSSLTIDDGAGGGGTPVSLTHSSTEVLNVAGDVTFVQPATNGQSNSWYINAGSATVGGTINYTGASTNNRNMRIYVTTGSLTAGALTFANISNDSRQSLNVTSTGSATITSPVSQADGSFIVSGGGTITFLGQVTVTGGTINIDGTSTMVFNNTGTYALDYGTGSTPTLTTVSGSTLKFNGDFRTTTAFTVHAASNSIFTGNSTMTPTALMTFGNLQIDPGVTLTAAGNIYVAGNWTNNAGAGSFAAGTYDVRFMGTGTQTIGGTNSTTFYDITFANDPATAGDVTLATNNYIVSNQIRMLQGNVNLNGRVLTLGINTVSTGTLSYTSGFFYGNTGRFRRWISASSAAMGAIASNSLGHFPMGTAAGDYRPLWISYSADLTAGGTVSVLHNGTTLTTAGGHTDASWGTGTIVDAVTNSYWNIALSSFTLSGATGILRYGGQGFGTNTLADLDATLLASTVGTHGAATNAITTIEVNRTALTTANLANDWRIGTRWAESSPLPIELLSFNAKPDSNIVKLTWATATEINNDFFTVERSKNGHDFESIATVDGTGNSFSVLNYAATDNNPYKGVSYYRLKQTDFDGKYTYSHIVAVDLNDTQEEFKFEVFPNPSSGEDLNLSIIANKGEEVLVVVFDVNGKESYSKVVIVETEGENVYAVDQSKKLAPGIYMVTATSQENIYSKKLIVK